jgi:heme-degrading monooxygenase HmoA
MTGTAQDVSHIGNYPPDEESRALLAGVPGTRVTPGVVTALDGLELAGPEAAGALTLLHTTFACSAAAQRGYRNFAAIKEDFRTRPGFLRLLTFNDGPHGYALGLWRGTDDVAAFVASAAHQQMVRQQRERPFEYSQFAGVWATQKLGRRNLYCPLCGTATAAPARRCANCDNELDDPFRT